MLSENAIFQVLVTSGDQAIAAVDTTLGQLALGQIGIFNADTNTALNAAKAAKAKRFYIAVGVDVLNTGVTNDVIKSSGQHIQAGGIKAVTARCYTPEQPQVIDVTDFFAFCERSYVLRTILTNQSALRRYGKNLPYKSFIHTTSCCAATCNVTCKNFASEVAYSWVNQINADDDHLLSAELIDYTTDPENPEVIDIEDYQTWVDEHTTVDDMGDSDPTNDVTNALGLGVRITTKPSAMANYCTLNMGYDYPRGTVIMAALGGDFQCSGKVTPVQSMIYEEGSGYDIQQLESDASGWYSDRGHYRLSELNGVERQGYSPIASRTGKYAMININAYHSSIEDRTYESNHDNIIAIPCGSNTTISQFLAVLDAITNLQGGMDALADDLAACPACDVANAINKTPAALLPAAYALDGIA